MFMCFVALLFIAYYLYKSKRKEFKMKKIFFLITFIPCMASAQVSVSEDEIRVGDIVVNGSDVSIGDRIKVKGGNVEINANGNSGISVQSDGNNSYNEKAVHNRQGKAKSFVNDDIVGRDFSGQDLRYANFTNADLTDVNFTGSNLTGAKFINSDLKNVNMTNALLINVCFKNVGIVDSIMVNTNLSGSATVNTDFDNVDFTGAIRNKMRSSCDDINHGENLTSTTAPSAVTSEQQDQATSRPKITSAAAIVDSLSKVSGSIDLTVNFKTDSADLFGNAHAQVTEIAKAIKDEQLKGKNIEIQGHTDSQGEDEYNLDLSYRRAATVQKVLINDYNTEMNQLSIKGYGESQPIANNIKYYQP